MVREKVQALFNSIDDKDSAAFSRFLDEHCRFRFGNQPFVEGRVNIEAFVAAFFDSIHGLQHTVIEQWFCDGALICHGEVCYTRHNGTQLTVPFANTLKIGPQGIVEYLIFADTSALYSDS